jgi:Cu/Ag efflux protein CusF
MKKFMLAIILVIPMVSTAYAQQEMSASGQVVSVRLLTRTMTIRDASANEVIRYSVPMGTTVTLAGQPGRLGYLRSGDTVNVNYVNTDEGRQAVRVRVPEPTSAMDMRIAEGPMSTITGRVEGVNYGNRTITVLGDQSGERFTYAVPRGTRVTVGGDDARIGHIQRGDSVILRFNEQDGQRQAARVRVPEPVTPLAARREQAAPATVAQTAPPAQLPRTASPLPLFGLIGALSLLIAGSLRLVRRHSGARS